MTVELKPISLTVDAVAIDAYAKITGDFNPIHTDSEFAAKSPMGGIIAHGTLSLNLIWQAIEANFGKSALEGAKLDVRFVKPVRIGDTITATYTLNDESNRSFEVSLQNQNGESVIDGQFWIPQSNVVPN